MTMNRRDFLKGAGSALALGGGLFAGLGGTTPIAAAATPDKWDFEVDVAVAGGGNGGLSAAAAAAQEGKSVILAEISGFLGGGSAYSGGIIHCWGLQNWEEYNKHTEGLHDQVLGKTYVETFRKTYIPWLQSIGMPLTKLSSGRGFNQDWQMGSGESGYLKHKAYFDALVKFITGKGGKIMTKTRVLRLVADEQGKVLGIEAKNETGRIFIKANKGVILATGGFQNNKGLMAHAMPNGEMARIMAVPYSTGDGMLMAQGVGAMTSGSFSTFSGVLCAVAPGPATEEIPELYEKYRAGDAASLPGLGNGRPIAPQWINPTFEEYNTAILVNLQGKRFIDESSPIDAKYPRIPQTVIKQKRGMALMVADKGIYDQSASSGAILDIIKSQGGQVFVADTIEDLAGKLADAYGLYASAFIRTIKDYNYAIDNKIAGSLEIPRVANQNKIAVGPFYAVAVTPAVYHTFGGLLINEKAQVLDAQKEPISNLYACPPVAGIFREPYAGGIGSAGTFGYIAGKTAAKL